MRRGPFGCGRSDISRTSNGSRPARAAASNNDSTCSGDNSATNAEDFVLNVGGGGGVLIAFSEAPRVPRLDLSFRYLRGGEATYLTKGAIRREGSTAIFDVSRSRTDMVALYIGAVFGR